MVVIKIGFERQSRGKVPLIHNLLDTLPYIRLVSPDLNLYVFNSLQTEADKETGRFASAGTWYSDLLLFLEPDNVSNSFGPWKAHAAAAAN